MLRRKLALAAVLTFLVGCGLGLFGLAGSRDGIAWPARPTSPYRLPWTGSERHLCIQGNLSWFTHRGRNAHAWDFWMPVGTPVRSMRAGRVVRVEKDRHGIGLHTANLVEVEHADGTVAVYAHLRRHGAAVEVGDDVRAGDLLGYSGMSGRTLYPHLHVQLEVDDRSVPLVFAEVPGDGIPRFGRRYEASPRQPTQRP